MKIKSYFMVYFIIIIILSRIEIISQEEKETEKFKSIKIGDQIWMAENLNINKFQTGSYIVEVKSREEWIEAAENGTPAWCYYENDPANGKKYGKLYNAHAVNSFRGLAPKGWHIPTVAEFETLANSVKDNAVNIKATGIGLENGVGTNTSGFSAELAGYRNKDGYFVRLGSHARFWTSVQRITGNGFFNYGVELRDYGQNIDLLFYYEQAQGFSVRCVKN